MKILIVAGLFIEISGSYGEFQCDSLLGVKLCRLVDSDQRFKKPYASINRSTPRWSIDWKQLGLPDPTKYMSRLAGLKTKVEPSFKT